MRRVKSVFLFLLMFVMLSNSLGIDVYATSKKTTVQSISQDTSAAVKLLNKNVGKIKKSGIIPGLMQTVTRTKNGNKVVTCDSMVPQGMTFAGDYLLISAYCKCGSDHRSVIYVLDSDDRTYETTLILDVVCHVGGIARKGDYLWVCDSSNGKYLRAYKFSDVKKAIGHKYWTIYTQAKRAIATTPSFLCSANGYLYVGTFSEDVKKNKIYYYSTSGTSLTKKGYIVVSNISKIQGISIRDNYMVLTSSYGRKNKSNVYVYKDDTNFTKNKKEYKKPYKSFVFPNMVEGCHIGPSNTYFLFESGAKAYRESKKTMPFDKFVGMRNIDLGINN